MNLRVIFGLPYSTPCWLVEKLSNGKHAKQLIYSRFTKFMDSISKCSKPQVISLLKFSMNDCRATTGANLREILLDTGVKAFPGVTNSSDLHSYVVNKLPSSEEWKFPLLVSLIELRDARWELIFDEDESTLKEDHIETMINSVCTR